MEGRPRAAARHLQPRGAAASSPTTRSPRPSTTTPPPTGDYKRKACPATPEVDATLTHVLTTLDDLAAAGVFPPVADTCTFCDFQAVCGPFRESRAPRARRATRGSPPFRRLREIP